MRHPPERCLRLRQQRVAGRAPGKVADPWHGEIGTRRCLDGGGHRVPIEIGEHGSHTLADQGLRDGAADAIARPRHQRRLARGIEGCVQEAHGGGIPRGMAVKIQPDERNVIRRPTGVDGAIGGPW